MTDLRPCPFCGSENELVSTPDLDAIACLCGATMSGITCASLAAKWNHRVELSVSSAKLQGHAEVVGTLLPRARLKELREQFEPERHRPGFSSIVVELLDHIDTQERQIAGAYEQHAEVSEMVDDLINNPIPDAQLAGLSDALEEAAHWIEACPFENALPLAAQLREWREKLLKGTT